MKKFKYEISISAGSSAEANAKMKALITIVNKLNTDELLKIEEVVSNPVQLAVIKSKLM